MSYGSRPAAMEMARHLGDIYNGGKVMLVTGSPQHNVIMQLSGISLINFYTADKFDTAPSSFPDVKYVILSKRPDPNLHSVAKTWHDGIESTGFLRNYFEQNFDIISSMICQRFVSNKKLNHGHLIKISITVI